MSYYFVSNNFSGCTIATASAGRSHCHCPHLVPLGGPPLSPPASENCRIITATWVLKCLAGEKAERMPDGEGKGSGEVWLCLCVVSQFWYEALVQKINVKKSESRRRKPLLKCMNRDIRGWDQGILLSPE